MVLSSLVCTLALGLGQVVAASATTCQAPTTRAPRVFLLSDIANEPDDAQSMVRLMAYANELDIQGLVATTSIWLNDTTRPDQMHEIVDAYEASVFNLRKHAQGWPEPSYLRSLVTSGLPVYGMDGVGEGKDSDGSDRLIQAVDASDEPLWVMAWGGASVLAQALWHVNRTRDAIEIDKFVSKVRAYAISDQDNTGVWIRRNWPGLFYIASVHHFNRYAVAGWAAISGEPHYHFPSMADMEVISKEWIAANIQSAGPLGARYPDPEFIIEGDTPALLYMIPNGLSDPEHPEWGSWGGRYGPVNYGEGHFADSVDVLVDEASGRTFMGSHVTIWRWRKAFQNDFAARMSWSVHSKFQEASHQPVASVNGDVTRDIIKIMASSGEAIELDASNSCDPDGNTMTYSWWQYLEPSSNNNTPKRDVATLHLSSTDTAKITVTIPPEEILRAKGRHTHPEADKHLHLILEVSNGKIVSYRRVLFTILGPASVSSPSSASNAHDEL